MAYMVAAYMIIWAGVFAVVISIVQRQRNLQREIHVLKELARDKGAQSQ